MQLVHEELIAAGPAGSLAGTLTMPAEAHMLDEDVPVLLFVPGSGPTDRHGNSPLGVSAAPYRLLAEALAAQGYPSLRIDKRGMFGSASAIPDPNDVTIAAYEEDLVSWAKAIQGRLPVTGGTRCVIPVGHSEGGLVALSAMANMTNPCGLVLIASPGRPLDAVIREQLHANPANAPFLDEAGVALAALKRGQQIDPLSLRPELRTLFAAQVQGYLIDAFSHDPVELAAQIDVPMLVVQGTRDLQVRDVDAVMLAEANPRSKLALLPEVNHVLKIVASEDPQENLTTYGDPNLPIARTAVDAVSQFLYQLSR
ncbi:alpha/beta hydrolase [Epibacterium sp. Ofav1-8]|uniref:alpha/beta hydrolase n=1 Tax=Epibacterium sp. Ofav1-8 TaxID=2917735 RepID=UPI001EF73EDC|nr:alpha/beta fold hydrolase [Epibacterium sp. Ofav1-8]MCG7625899.1 alpha/beta fold hydrolase [Epibacterium sp. Ofav1-8]